MYVGQPGDMFYDQTTGQLKISDGTTPGGSYVTLVIATPTQVGGIKAGPGANVGTDGTLTIDTTGLPLSIGNLSIVRANISTTNANQDLNLISNGTGNVNLLGNLQLFSTIGSSNYGFLKTPILAVNNNGNVITNGNLITNGKTIHNGNVIVFGNLLQTGATIQSGPSTFIVTPTASQSSLEITSDTNGAFQPPQNAGVVLHTTGPTDGNAGRVYFDSVNNASIIAGRRYNGNIASPTQILANQDIVRYAGTPYSSSGWPAIGPARMAYVANEDITSTNQGGRIEFWTTPNGAVASTSIQRTVTIDPAIGITSNLGVTAVGNVSAANINVATSGTLTTPRIILNDGGVRQLTGNTAVTLDFITDSMVSLTNPSGTVTITLANYVAGAIIRFIYSSATARAINLGVAGAVNSTTGATSIGTAGGGIGPNQSVILTYYCVGGTAATTYVSASYA